MSETLKVVKISDRATIPFKSSCQAAGFDLYSAFDYIISPKGKCLVHTDLKIKVPTGTYGRIAPRSGLALHQHLDVGGGVIDQDFTGNIAIILFNHSDDFVHIFHKMRVAQLICEKFVSPSIEICDSLEVSERNPDGFGSSGCF
jgi:dUTP pyrophosphatase